MSTIRPVAVIITVLLFWNLLAFGGDMVTAKEPVGDSATVVKALPVEEATEFPWKYKLSLDGGGFWKKRIELLFSNNDSADLEHFNCPVVITSAAEGTSPVLSALVGEVATSVRLTNEKGVELLFGLIDENRQPLQRGAIPDGASVLVPVNCKAGNQERFFLYFDNDKAWELPDRIDPVGSFMNPDFELGEGNVPAGWVFDTNDNKHRIEWVDESPHHGDKCVKVTVDDGALPTWVSARQLRIPVVAGSNIRFSAWVRGDRIKGQSGWYFHLGAKERPMIASPMVPAGDGTFDWKKVELQFTVPDNANVISYGTVLYGTGTAWFDDIQIEVTAPERPVAWTMQVLPTESSEIAIHTPSEKTIQSIVPPGNRYALLRFINDTASPVKTIARLNLGMLQSRWNRSLQPGDFSVYDLTGNEIIVQKWNENAFFEVELPEMSCSDFLLVEDADSFSTLIDESQSSPETSHRSVKDHFPGTSLQQADSLPMTDSIDNPAPIKSNLGEPFPDYLKERNLIINGDFSRLADDGIPVGWSHDPVQPGIEYSIIPLDDPVLGKNWVQLSVSPDVPKYWRGWRQTVKVEPKKSYFAGMFIRCDSPSGSYQLHLHQRRSDGELTESGMGGIGPPISGKSDWILLTGNLVTAHDAELLEFHLTTDQVGTVAYSNVFLFDVTTAEIGELSGGLGGIFQVPAIIKVFEDSTFPAGAKTINSENPARIAAARNEQESLQLAFRSDSELFLQFQANPPRLVGTSDANPLMLPAPELFAVGNVPVDFPTNYYQSTSEPPIRLIPQAATACDGWRGMWPDPLIPVKSISFWYGSRPIIDISENSLDRQIAKQLGQWRNQQFGSDSEKLAELGKYGIVPVDANKTRAVWLNFSIPKDTPAGIYRGVVFIRNMVGRLDSIGSNNVIPYEVEVFDFTLPDQPACGAVYDVRVGEFFSKTVSREETEKKVISFMASKRLSPDSVLVSPEIIYHADSQSAEADWTKFDEWASWYFDELHIRKVYMPQDFYLFGWAMPPKPVEGEQPYPGAWPFDEADRSVLRPEYKKAYQTRLATFWNHLKEKGWDKRFILYISDEPFYTKEPIINQMKALCAMIHEVDPEIQIYCSTWHHVPEWDGSLDVWGIGHYGIVPTDEIRRIQEVEKGSVWWTTDGQMCLDTPYCAVERLLPWWCHFYGAEAYEFWGATWYTYDPFRYGWHSYIHQVDTPGQYYYVRYPNGDGYILYPGNLIGLEDDLISSVRLEQAREGVEDASYLAILQDIIAQSKEETPEIAEAKELLQQGSRLVPIPVAGGRYSTHFLPKPEVVESLKYRMGKMIESLKVTF